MQVEGEKVQESVQGASVKLPWFRMYTEAVDDEKLSLLAFEDRWHFIALLCCKGQGILDAGGTLLMRKVAVKLGITVATLEEVARRLGEVELIDPATLQPTAWDDRQFRSDSSTDRVRAYRERMKRNPQRDGNVSETFPERDGNGGVTAQDTDTDTDTEAEAEEKHKRSASPVGDTPVSDKALDTRFLKKQGVDAQHAKDWLAVRRKKRLPLTVTAWQATCEEAAKAGMTPADAVAMSAREGWAGFKSSWVARAASGGAQGGVINRAEAIHENNKRAAAEGVRLIHEREARRNGGAVNKPADDGNTIDMDPQ
jgi:hypothetical protein